MIDSIRTRYEHTIYASYIDTSPKPSSTISLLLFLTFQRAFQLSLSKSP